VEMGRSLLSTMCARKGIKDLAWLPTEVEESSLEKRLQRDVSWVHSSPTLRLSGAIMPAAMGTFASADSFPKKWTYV